MISVRTASPADAVALAALDARTWKEAYWGVLPDAAVVGRTETARSVVAWRRRLARIADDPAGSDETVLLAALDGAAAGFVWTGPARSVDPAWEGEVYMLYVRDRMQRRGVGRGLLACAARALARRGLFSMGLWTLEDNHRARAFTEAMGAARVSRRMQTVGGAPTALIAYEWPDLAPVLGSVRVVPG